MNILVTGVAGFIGYHVAKNLMTEHNIVGIDNLNDYYDVNLKLSRIDDLKKADLNKNFNFMRLDLGDTPAMQQFFNEHKFDIIINLAAQAGVRYSIDNPHVYAQSNLLGFLNILEGARSQQVQHLVYASSSSVYGLNAKLPFSENVPVDHPISFYGATKRCNELMAHSYSSLYNIPTTGLRFFTVYGPWGRPDMALFKFTKAILNDETIDVFNYGNHLRDFTYIDDIVNGIVKISFKTAKPNTGFDPLNPQSASSSAPWRIFNIGNNSPVKLTEYINLIEEYLGKKAKINLLPLQVGDVPDTYADVSNLEHAVAYKPSTPVSKGVKNFLDWYMEHYQKCVV